MDLPQVGEIRKGTIASIGSNQILVSIGAKSEGVIAGRELEQLTEEERSALKVGQEVDVYVINPEDDNGNVVLSFERAQEQLSWGSVEKMLTRKTVVREQDDRLQQGRADRAGRRAAWFRASLADQRGAPEPGQRRHPRAALAEDGRRADLGAHHRGGPRTPPPDPLRARTSNESRQSIKDRVISELEEGKIYTGRVTSLADFGAFVNINGADGLVHLSELSWDRVQHPKEMLEVGQEVKVKVINIDREKKRIGLSLRALQDDPWTSRV